MNIGEKITVSRKRLGWSQEDLAVKLDVSRQAVSRWETGAASPDVTTVAKLARILGVTADYLVLDEITEPVSPAAGAQLPDPVAERRRRFRIAFGLGTLLFGLALFVASLFLAQALAETRTWWNSHLGRFGTSLFESWPVWLFSAGLLLFFIGAVVLVLEYRRKD